MPRRAGSCRDLTDQREGGPGQAQEGPHSTSPWGRVATVQSGRSLNFDAGYPRAGSVISARARAAKAGR